MTELSTILVTGLSGLIGSRLERLAASQYRLVNLDVTVGIDITNREQVLDVMRRHADAQALIHLAAFTNVSAAYAQQGDREGACYQINVAGTETVARACGEHGLRLVHVSTDFVFDGEKDTPYTEGDAPRPIEWYGATKQMAEDAARLADDWTIVRIAFPYVAGPAPRADLVRTLRDKLAGGQTLNLFTDQIITPTFADDVASGLLLLAQTGAKDELFHLAGSTSLSPYELGHAIAREFGFNASLVRPSSLQEYLKTDPRPRQRCLRLSNANWTAFAEAHDLAKPLDIRQGLKRVREAESANA